MRIVEAAILTSIAVGFVWIVWHLWKSRHTESVRASQNAELAQLSRTMTGISHDLQNLINSIQNNLPLAATLKADDLKVLIDDMERAARSASKLVEAARAPTTPLVSLRSMEGTARLGVALMRGEEVPVALQVEGDFEYRGSDTDALRIVQNLLLNAVREAKDVPGGKVIVRLDRESLRVTNSTRTGVALPASIWEPGVSFRGSSGVGLAVVREAAGRIGCAVSDDSCEGQVTFVLRPLEGTYRS